MIVNIEDTPALIDYLRGTGRIRPTEEPRVRALSGGVSNRTVLVERPSGEAWVIKQALEKLRVPVDWFSSPARIHREALGLAWLERLAPPGTITPLVFEDRDQFLLAMEAVPTPHENWKVMLLNRELVTDHALQFGRLLAAIHSRAFERADAVEPEFSDRSFFESLRIEPYYEYTASQHPDTAEFYEDLIDETLSLSLTLVHGDYSPKNILVRDGRLILLDHEVIHFGDPAFDIGFSLTQLLSKANHIPDRTADFVRLARLYWDTYVDSLGNMPWKTSLEERAVRHTLGCLLARIDGRSPNDYLTDFERDNQRRATLRLIDDPPYTIDTLISDFIAGL